MIKWYDHVQREGEEGFPGVAVWQEKNSCKRGIGRPSTRWKDAVDENIRKAGIHVVEDFIQWGQMLGQGKCHFGLLVSEEEEVM